MDDIYSKKLKLKVLAQSRFFTVSKNKEIFTVFIFYFKQLHNVIVRLHIIFLSQLFMTKSKLLNGSFYEFKEILIYLIKRLSVLQKIIKITIKEF